jgi:hypothetical protein
MNVRGVDPRDIEREVKAVYRVHFWSAGRTLSDEFELTDAPDVHEVLRWIDANADGREVEAWSWSTDATSDAARCPVPSRPT